MISYDRNAMTTNLDWIPIASPDHNMRVARIMDETTRKIERVMMPVERDISIFVRKKVMRKQI